MQPSAVELEELLTPVRAVLQADGAELEVIDWDQHRLSARLVLETAECRECVLPRAALEETMLAMLQPGYDSLREVALTDPREA